MGKARFKVGDSVELVTSHGDRYGPKVGSVGVVVAIASVWTVDVGVEWKNYHDGHDAEFGDDRDTCWYVRSDTIRKIKAAKRRTTSIADDIRLKPQAKTILRHLTKRKSISPMEALNTYGIYRLSASIHELRAVGHNVTTQKKRDAVGHQYARYVYKKAA